MNMVDIDNNGLIELEELNLYSEAQELLIPCFNKLNTDILGKAEIHQLFETIEELKNKRDRNCILVHRKINHQ